MISSSHVRAAQHFRHRCPFLLNIPATPRTTTGLLAPQVAASACWRQYGAQDNGAARPRRCSGATRAAPPRRRPRRPSRVEAAARRRPATSTKRTGARFRCSYPQPARRSSARLLASCRALVRCTRLSISSASVRTPARPRHDSGLLRSDPRPLVRLAAPRAHSDRRMRMRSSRRPKAISARLSTARSLLAPTEQQPEQGGSPFGSRYFEALQREPSVVLAHAEVRAAQEESGACGPWQRCAPTRRPVLRPPVMNA